MKKIGFILGGVAVIAAGILFIARYLDKELTGFTISDLDLDFGDLT